GRVAYDYPEDETGSAAPAWLRELIGDDYFRTANAVWLQGKEFDDPDKLTAALERVAALANAELLSIDAAGLRPDHVAEVARLPAVRGLGLMRNVTDDCLANLSSMSGLRELQVEGTFTDAGLAHLANLNQLRELLAEGKFTGAGVAHLQELTQL